MQLQQELFDRWVRGRFADINTSLERANSGIGPSSVMAGSQTELKQALLDEGRRHIVAVLAEDRIPGDFEGGFELLGNVGFYMAACHRHGLNDPGPGGSPLHEASRLALRLGASLGVAPRFIAAHFILFNRALEGAFKSFTHLEAERLFIEKNVLGVLAYRRAGAALETVVKLGISHPACVELLMEAREALLDVVKYDEALDNQLDVQEFFEGVRSYYRPHPVGARVYRGANAGDFAGISQVDLLLGLCQAGDPFYLEYLNEKQPYLLPADRETIGQCLGRVSLLDEFLRAAPEQSDSLWFRRSLRAFLEACRAHGQGAAFHQNRLVARFIAAPARHLPPEELNSLTASGPPLDVLLVGLEKLRDLRLAKDRPDIQSRYADLAVLKRLLSEPEKVLGETAPRLA